MKDTLRSYIESLFEEAPATKKAVELKEELIQNLNDKYDDLLSEGKTPEAAYNLSVAGIGDVSSLIEDLKKDIDEQTETAAPKAKKRSALFVSSAVMLYILSVIPVLLLGSCGYELQGVVLMFLCIAAATGLLVYNGMTKPTYRKKDDTVVEEFKAWKSENTDRVRVRKAVSSALWMLVVVLYFLISFYTMRWDISWIIFLIGAVVENVFRFFFDPHDSRNIRKILSSVLWLLIVIAYFFISFTTMRWGVTWIIFLIGAMIESILTAIFALAGK